MSKEFSVVDLKQHDGKTNPTIYVALHGNVFDVTDKGMANYGPGGQYSAFAGMDISRAMATMTMTTKDSFDDLDDLTEEQRKNLMTWEATFLGKYPVVGKLVK